MGSVLNEHSSSSESFGLHIVVLPRHSSITVSSRNANKPVTVYCFRFFCARSRVFHITEVFVRVSPYSNILAVNEKQLNQL